MVDNIKNAIKADFKLVVPVETSKTLSVGTTTKNFQRSNLHANRPKYGCCQDRVTPAEGRHFKGCAGAPSNPKQRCEGNKPIYGCCWNGDEATGPGSQGCAGEFNLTIVTDTKEKCSHWAHEGLCKRMFWNNFMKKHCPQSCGYCHGVKEDQKKGGLLSIDLNSRTTSVLLRNDTEVCSECTGIASHQDGVLFCDAGTFQVKYLDQECNVEMIAGNGREGNAEGRAENSSFGQLMGICTENTNIFVTDPQTGCVKLVTTITGTVTFLKASCQIVQGIFCSSETSNGSPLTDS
ncbi:hypothetical protein OS493_001747 [Desmophyllum pertusum]|uniref:ShKT domain-containing protein n=1 Tax=Desmophyllum pertusum TaxID=174260 RepID=A0A9W9Z433_9CNID|nr:hypothetical protein OS493_001747 [Desmophyllum pertusum]